MTAEQAKRPEVCRSPCKCPNDPPRCKTSATIKDGCDCCRVCPRQQGDLCDHRFLCDDEKHLYCDFTVDAGHRGICRGDVTIQSALYRGVRGNGISCVNGNVDGNLISANFKPKIVGERFPLFPLPSPSPDLSCLKDL